jgi:hypothetical protein
MILFWAIVMSFNHCIKFSTNKHISNLKYLSIPSTPVFLLTLHGCFLSVNHRSVPPIEFNLMHYLIYQSLLVIASASSREVAPADCSLHRPVLVIDGVLVVYDAGAVWEGQYVALFVCKYFTDVAVFEDETCPETPTGAG